MEGSNEPSDNQQNPKAEKLLTLEAKIHNTPLTNTRVYAAADKYEIPDLKHLAHEKLRSRLRLKPFPWHEFHIKSLKSSN